MPEALILPGMADAEPDLSTFENKTGLAEDMKFLASMPELCDVTFLVGDTREPVCAVKAVLASRSRVFAKMLYAAPSPQRKRETSTKENKLRLFLKRSSEPLLNLQNAAQQRTGFTQQLAPIPEPSGQQHQTLIIEEFEPDVFRQLIEYIHTGCVTLQPRTLLGVMNAADYYGLEELRRACAGFVQCCINVDTVCALLASAERYIQYKCTKTLVQKVLEFVDEHGNEVLNLGSFTLLPQHVVRLILAREELRADEFTKFQAALMWSKKYYDNNPNIDIKEILGTFVEYIQFHKIPANVLMREIHPLNLVPYTIIMNALAYQADPESIDPGKLSPNSSRQQPHSHHRHRHHHQSLPKIRKAKSQSFRTRRSPSERRSPNNAPNLTFNTALTAGTGANGEKKRSPLTPKSPVLPAPESKSPGSSSQKTPTSLSRQGTLRASNRRKNSGQLSISLGTQGRRSPVGLNDRSPQGRRSPLFPGSGLRSPNDPLASPTLRSPTGEPRRTSPTFSVHTQERRSPLGAVAPTDFGCQFGAPGSRRSPTSTVHVQDMGTEPEDFGFGGMKRPSISLFTPIYFASEKRSPMGPIPPITVSNPAETYKSAEREREAAEAAARELEKEKEREAAAQPQQEKKSVMREILAFVRKPSKHISTRTNRFANAFTRAESGSSSGPLIRQSTFSASPAASSTAAKSAVQKQMSEVGFEPKMSLKFAHYTKMSLKLRRSAKREEEEKEKEKQKQGSSAAGSKRPSADLSLGHPEQQVGGASAAEEELPFELANVHFEKVGESYIKHERLRELEEPFEAESQPEAEASKEPEAKKEVEPDAAMAQFVEEVTNSLKVVALNGDGGAVAVHHFTRRSESREPIEPRISEERESDSNDLMIPEEMRAELVEILKAYPPEPVYVNLQALRRETEEPDPAAAQAENVSAALLAAEVPEKKPLQCPTIEFEPPSRRSSFDPPRSPFLEQLRSPGVDTETDLINLQRLDSGGDSFELVESKWSKSSRGESSFDCPYSSRDTSFDVSISRYQSTSYEDQTSSFEIVDTDERAQGRRAVDLRKSSIELVDAETFQRSGSSCGGRKSSLETHFDYTPTEGGGRSPSLPFPAMTKKQRTENFRQLHVSPFSAFSRARSPLSQQTSSNYSSRDSYDSSGSYPHGYGYPPEPQKSPYGDPSRKHFPLTVRQKGDEEREVRTFLCTDQRCASIFEPRPSSVLTQQLSTGSMSTPSGYTNGTPRVPGAVPSGPVPLPHPGPLSSCGFSSGSEFEPPSPRRAASASPKHTFTFRIVMKKVDSSPEALCPERHRSRIIDRYRRRDSRRKRIHDAGKSF
ncbi:uncharacterized protein Dana_GF11400, isoform E [Drosophila ananassae]|uniref:Uncharacterized protein, isoform E n=1 Tax=Drosophila ananassae TaxID=7217 RepID=B3MDK1_DROAN|nr:serine-enriched protein isoform X3 [Drosophila ananassae]EDV37464.2 uncharacterized protein Dana_GF11400, isoform E [Drosophila ananassae]